MRRGPIKSEHTHTHIYIVDSETKQFLFQPRCALLLLRSLPLFLRSRFPTNVPHSPPFASNRRAQWNFFGREREKGIFLEITTGVLRAPSEKENRERERERERERKKEGEKERERSKRRNRPTGKKARRSPLAPPSTAYKGEKKRAMRRRRRRRPSYRAEGRTRECVKRIGSRHDDPQMPLYGPSTPRGTYLDLGPGMRLAEDAIATVSLERAETRP